MLSNYFLQIVYFRILARAKRERVVQDGVEKANRRPTDPTDTASLTPYLKFDIFYDVLFSKLTIFSLERLSEKISIFFNFHKSGLMLVISLLK